jgi:hypothetical protein
MEILGYALMAAELEAATGLVLKEKFAALGLRPSAAKQAGIAPPAQCPKQREAKSLWL